MYALLLFKKKKRKNSRVFIFSTPFGTLGTRNILESFLRLFVCLVAGYTEVRSPESSCHLHRVTLIYYLNYLNLCYLDKHRLGFLVPLRQAKFTLCEKEDLHSSGVPAEKPIRSCWNKYSTQGVPRQSCPLLWSQTHQC